MKIHKAATARVVSVIVSLLFAPWAAQAADEPAVVAEKNRTAFGNFMSDGKEVFVMPFRKENLPITALVVGAVGVSMLLFDDRIQNKFYPDRKEETPDAFRHVGDSLQFAGLAYGSVMGLHGMLFRKEENKREALLSYETYVWTAASLGALKWITGRERPEQTGDPFKWKPKDHASSFPSGHTTQAFAAATLISEHYDTPWVTVPAFAAATSVGVSRALANKHWASDTIAGAALGVSVAHLMRRLHRERNAVKDAEDEKGAWRIEPEGIGIRLVREF